MAITPVHSPHHGQRVLLQVRPRQDAPQGQAEHTARKHVDEHDHSLGYWPHDHIRNLSIVSHAALL